MAEVQLRTALAAGEGNPAVLVGTPLSTILLIVAALFLLAPVLLRRLAK
jgi:putative tricarboxylic transport membrane protein